MPKNSDRSIDFQQSPSAAADAGKLTLVIETSSGHGSIALAGRTAGCSMREFGSDRRHNSAIFEPLAALLAGLEPGEIGQIGQVLVGSGPGSYSGTRVGIAAGQGVALAHGAELVAVPSILGLGLKRSAWVLGDARRGSYWLARLEAGKLWIPPTVFEQEEFRAVLAAEAAPSVEILSFEPTAKLAAAAGFPEDRIALAVPNARALWDFWNQCSEAERNEFRAVSPQPIYLKPPHITAARTDRHPWLARGR